MFTTSMKDKASIINDAQKFAKRGRIDKAIAEWSKLLAVSKDGHIYNTVGDLYLKKGAQDDAIEFFTNAAKIFKKNGFHSKAIAIYNKILTIEPTKRDAVIALSKLNAERGFHNIAAEDLFKFADTGRVASNKTPKRIKGQTKKRRLYMTLVAFIAVATGATLTIMFEDIRRGPITLIQAIKSISSEDADKRPISIFFEEAPHDVATIKELSEPLQVSNIPEINNDLPKEEKLIPEPIVTTIEKELSEPLQVSNIPEINNDLPKEEKLIPEHVVTTIDSESELNKKLTDPAALLIDKEVPETSTLNTEISFLESSSDIPQKTEKENEPAFVSEIEPAPEIKNKSLPKIASIVQSNTADLKKQPATFDEMFNNNINNWDIFDTLMASAQIEGGEYHIENKREKGLHIIPYYYDPPHNRDFILEASITTERSSDNHSYGFVFGAMDTRNNYTFQIRANELYSIGKYHKGTFQELSGGRIRDTVINQNSVNTLKIVKQGNNMRFYVNDYYLDEFLNLSFYGNKLGFAVEGKSKIAIDETHSHVWFENKNIEN